MIPFLVLAMGRSGTQWLTALLTAHPDVRALGEPLNPVGEGVSDDALRRCWQLAPGATAVGFTLLQEQLAGRPLTLPRLLVMPELRVIVLERRNQLERLRSDAQAHITRHWGVGNPPSPQPTIVLDPDQVLYWLRTATAFHSQLREIRRPKLWLFYEDLVQDTQQVVKQLWDFLEVCNPGPRLVNAFRQESRPLVETVSNLEEVRCHLIGTPYEEII